MSKENLHKEQDEEEKKEETIPNWVKLANYAFKLIRERVNNYINNGWYTKVLKKSITMNPVKTFLQYIVSGKFNNAEEAKKMYLDNVYGDEQKIRKSDNRTDCKKGTIEVYDQVKKIFITPSPVSDMGYVTTYDKSDEDEEDYESTNKQPGTTDMSDLESEEFAKQRKKQKGQGVKILTPQQMPISFAQLKAGNNSVGKINKTTIAFFA